MYENYTEISSSATPNEGRTIINGQMQHLYDGNFPNLSASTFSANTIYTQNIEILNSATTSFITADVVTGARYEVCVSGGSLVAKAV